MSLLRFYLPLETYFFANSFHGRFAFLDVLVFFSFLIIFGLFFCALFRSLGSFQFKMGFVLQLVDWVCSFVPVFFILYVFRQ